MPVGGSAASNTGGQRYPLEIGCVGDYAAVGFDLEVSVPEATRDLDGIFDRYFAAYESGWRAFPDVPPLIAKLRDRGIAVGILTNGTRAQQLKKLTAIGLEDVFGVVCISEEIEIQKPDVRAFETLARGFNVSTSEVVFVGDHPSHDIAGARAAGVRAGVVERYATPPVNLDTTLEHSF